MHAAVGHVPHPSMAWNPAAYAPVPPPAPTSPHSLTPGKDDTALFKDARLGFSHLLPGRPVLGGGRADSDPPADATVHLQDAPITIRYRMEAPSFVAGSAAELARGTAGHFAAWRAQSAVPIDWANDSWLASWGAEAAAVGSYEVPETKGDGAMLREDLFVLVRQGAVLIVTWTYPRALAEHPAYAMFASVAEATMVWDGARWEQNGRVWPESPFVGPGLAGIPKAKYNELAKQVATTSVLPEERAQIVALLSGVVGSAGAPWVALAPEVARANHRAVLSTVKSSRLRDLVAEAFAEVRTAHDLRGLALVLGRALEPSRATRRP